MAVQEKALTRADIRGAKDRVCKRVDVPLWKGHVWLRSWTGTERDTFEARIRASRTDDAARNLNNIRAETLALSIVDGPDGALLYDITKPEDVAELGAKNGAVLDLLFTAATQLNAVTEADVESLAKN